MRKHFFWYTHGLPHSARLRDQIFHAGNYQQIEEIFSSYLELIRSVEVQSLKV
jgi:tRNA-dihydrouridine synthase